MVGSMRIGMDSYDEKASPFGTVPIPLGVYTSMNCECCCDLYFLIGEDWGNRPGSYAGVTPVDRACCASICIVGCKSMCFEASSPIYSWLGPMWKPQNPRLHCK